MPKKVALLIGVSEYGEGIPPLSAPPHDVAALKRVLENPKMGGFDEVETLINPDLIALQTAVQRLFSRLSKEDLGLLFFSGHGITDDNNRLYLATKGTAKDWYKATSVPASFVQDLSKESYAKRQVIVLDCCYSGAFAEGWQAKSVGLNLQKELGAEGRVVLTSSTATQTSFQQENAELSLYTQYLVEGMETGAADKDGDGKIHAHELHEYAKAKVKEVKPKMEPGIIIDREGFNILISLAPVNNPELEYRRLVEKYATYGEITVVGKNYLRVRRQQLGITEEKSDEIINEVLTPYRKRLENIELYKQTLIEAVKQDYPLTKRLLNELQDLQDVLGLEDKDIAEIKRQIFAEKEAEYQSQLEARQKEIEEVERQKQKEAERLKQQQEAQRKREKEETQKQEEAERLRQQEEEERRLRQQQEVQRQKQQAKPQPTIKTQPFEFETATVSLQKSGWFGGTKVEINRSRSQAEFFGEDLGNGVIMEMVAIPGGKFLMGTEDKEIERLCQEYGVEHFRREKPQHLVTVQPFFMGKYPVTQAQWKAVASLEKVERNLNLDPANFKGDNRPVEQVSWYDAVEFCQRLAKKTGRDYRLPSEAEWEYACRAIPSPPTPLPQGEGRIYPPFYFGETITTDLANYDGNYTYAGAPKGEYRQKTTPVGQFPPNAFGLYDMHGNVWEWCADTWHENYEGAPTDGSAWLSKKNSQQASNKVTANDKSMVSGDLEEKETNEKDSQYAILRGGSWPYVPQGCRSARRLWDRRGGDLRNCGFRVCCGSGRTL